MPTYVYMHQRASICCQLGSLLRSHDRQRRFSLRFRVVVTERIDGAAWTWRVVSVADGPKEPSLKPSWPVFATCAAREPYVPLIDDLLSSTFVFEPAIYQMIDGP